jgi:hypothetical protein
MRRKKKNTRTGLQRKRSIGVTILPRKTRREGRAFHPDERRAYHALEPSIY